MESTTALTDVLHERLSQYAKLLKVVIGAFVGATIWATTISINVRTNTDAIRALGSDLRVISAAVQRLVTLEEAAAKRDRGG